ncbi:MAG: stage III sporulation protein AA [Bacillota bacterium]
MECSSKTNILTSFNKIHISAHSQLNSILPFFPLQLKELLKSFPTEELVELEEIRLRVDKPLVCQIGGKTFWITNSGELAKPFTGEPFFINAELLQKVVALISDGSFYAIETELSQGYLTLPGGHRVGFTGEAVIANGNLKTLKNLNGLNFRIAREIVGAADYLIPSLIDCRQERVLHTLIISPPGAGKTTLLRDLIRQFSDGIPGLLSGVNIGLVDERSELAGSYRGVPQNDLGYQTDVLDGCPKALGMIILLRSMSPKIIAVDELGKADDVKAILEIINAGVTILATVHGYDFYELKERPVMGDLLRSKVFERYVILSRRSGPGTIEAILDGEGFQKSPKNLWKR